MTIDYCPCSLIFSSDKELAAAKERQEIELAAQRATLQEQRTHIDILDTALTNAQGNVVRLEEEVIFLFHTFEPVIYRLQTFCYIRPLRCSAERNKYTWKEWDNFNELYPLFKHPATEEKKPKDS